MANDIERGTSEATVKPTFISSVVNWASSWRVSGVFSLKSQNYQASGMGSSEERITSKLLSYLDTYWLHSLVMSDCHYYSRRPSKRISTILRLDGRT